MIVVKILNIHKSKDGYAMIGWEDSIIYNGLVEMSELHYCVLSGKC